MAIPPINNHIEWFVGLPVKARLKLEPTELEALMPKIVNTIPATNRPSAIALFIFENI
jgi:hypothetical protein